MSQKASTMPSDWQLENLLDSISRDHRAWVEARRLKQYGKADKLKHGIRLAKAELKKYRKQ